jgi:hypothetical protein
MERRTVLKVITGGVIAGPAAAQHHAAAPATNDAAYQLQFFNADQNALLAQLTELIIPADERSPGAREARVSEFIDLMVANSPADVQERWMHGLTGVEAEASAQFGRAFLECSAEQQDQILSAIAVNERAPSSDLERFFVQLKSMTVDGYYTTSIGIHQELRYKGNVPQTEFRGCTHPEHG